MRGAEARARAAKRQGGFVERECAAWVGCGIAAATAGWEEEVEARMRRCVCVQQIMPLLME